MLSLISQFELDKFCYYCIGAIRFIGYITNLSFSQVIILLCLIIEPLLIVLFGITTLISMQIKKEKVKTLIKCITIVIICYFTLFWFVFVGGYWGFMSSDTNDILEWQAETQPLN
ncbi:MAG: hypothetical protein IJ213_01080 [Bacteroidales bacterium]|nr:hypothetical protein [Bacteroidales bacterium]